MEQSNMRYLSIRECSAFHQVEINLLETFVECGVIEAESRDDGLYLPESELEPLEAAIRLHQDLRVNPEGIDVILHMRQQMQILQSRLRELEIRLRRFE